MGKDRDGDRTLATIHRLMAMSPGLHSLVLFFYVARACLHYGTYESAVEQAPIEMEMHLHLAVVQIGGFLTVMFVPVVLAIGRYKQKAACRL